MKLLKIDFNEIQKAMEDVSRDAFDYFLDLETGSVVTISQEMLEKAKDTFYKDDELLDEEHLEEYEMPDWMEEEIETALRVFSSEKERYIRIPERQSQEIFNLMKEFVEDVNELKIEEKLSASLSGGKPFSRFKKALADYPVYRKKWFAMNAGAMKKTITEWLESIGIKPEQGYYA
ncbi:MAG: hypothetical protein FP829_03125 [Nitrospirae bacterium]|nr:hypothetical protein [Nitrospirota bacterium]